MARPIAPTPKLSDPKDVERFYDGLVENERLKQDPEHQKKVAEILRRGKAHHDAQIAKGNKMI